MKENEFIRIPATVGDVMRQLETLSIAFPNTEKFYVLLAETIIPLEVTEFELKTAIKLLIGHHRGQLFIADVVDECLNQRSQGILREENAKLDRQLRQWKAEHLAEWGDNPINGDLSDKKLGGGMNISFGGERPLNVPKNDFGGVLGTVGTGDFQNG